MRGLTQDQLEKRRTGITSTDIRVLAHYYTVQAGKRPSYELPEYLSAVGVWASKLEEPEPEDAEGCALSGLIWEPILLEWYSHEVDEYVSRCQMTTCKGDTHYLATPDGLAVDAPPPVPAGEILHGGPRTGHGIECKTAWSYKQQQRFKESKHGVPVEYYLQCQWCLHVTGLDEWVLVALIPDGLFAASDATNVMHAWETDGNWYELLEDSGSLTIRTYDIERNQDQIDWLAGLADRFWEEHVEPGVRPEPDGSRDARQALKRHAPESESLGVTAGAEQEELLMDTSDAQAEAKAAKERYQQLKQRAIRLADEQGLKGLETPDNSIKVYRDARGSIRVKGD